MKNKILYIASTNTKKNHFDGERIKSTLIFDTLNKYFVTDLINLSRFKIFNTLKIAFISCFFKKKYSKIIISKDPHGANIIHKIFKFYKVDFTKVYYFEIGPFLYDRILAGNINKNTFLYDKLIIVETNSMKDELASLGFKNLIVFPNFKKIPSLDLIQQNYPKKSLKLVYFSRIEEMKGIYDLINAIKIVNSESIKYELDIYGLLMSKKDKIHLNELIKNTNEIKYKGTFNIKNESSYKILQQYDLHAFPTKYAEGFPGSLIDFFISGVPTISSTFRRSGDILSEQESYFFKQNDIDDLIYQLNSIYENQNTLNLKRKNTYLKKDNYSIEKFNEFVNMTFIN